MSGRSELALCIARFPVPDVAAVEAIRRAGGAAERTIVVMRDAFAARSARCPFGWEERAAMVGGGLAGGEVGPGALTPALSQGERESIGRVTFAPLREYFDDEKTVRALVHMADGAGDVTVYWVGEADPRLRDMLAGQPGWKVQPNPQGSNVQELQRQLFEGSSPSDAARALRDVLPEGLADELPAWLARADYERLRAEHRQIAHEKQQWSVAPYPVTLVTVDALVRAADHVLLVRRGRAPGQGLRALPGGFLEVQDTVYESAVRELQEETLLPLNAAQARALLKGVHVFDHPRRSQRGRVVTHAHYFDLGDGPLPKVRGGDDAAAADWVPIAQLTSMEDQFLDDHFHILDHFLGLGLTGA